MYSVTTTKKTLKEKVKKFMNVCDKPKTEKYPETVITKLMRNMYNIHCTRFNKFILMLCSLDFNRTRASASERGN